MTLQQLKYVTTVAKTDTEKLLSEVTVDTAGNLTYKVNQVDSPSIVSNACLPLKVT